MINRENIKERIFKSTFNVQEDMTEEEEVLYTNLVNSEKDREAFKVKSEKKLSNLKNLNQQTEDNLNKIEETLEDSLNRLGYKISKAVEKLRGSIIAERNTTSTIYSTIAQITNQETNQNTTTAIIKDNIAFGITSGTIDSNLLTVLKLPSLSFKNLSLKSINKKNNDELKDFIIKNKNHNSLPFEFTIDLRGLIGGSSLLILDLKDLAILEIYINGNLTQEKSLSDYFSIPIDYLSQTVTIRSYPTLHKSSNLYFNVIGITDLIYQEEAILETKQLPVNQTLTQLVLDVCDNARKDEVKIDYFLSINNKDYEKLNPVTKYSNKYDNQLQSIIKLSKDIELEMIEISGNKRVEGDIRYYLPTYLQNFLEYETYVYYPNITRDANNITKLYVNITKDLILNRNSLLDWSQDVRLDGIVQTESDIYLYKGIREISWSYSTSSFNYNYLETLIGVDNIYKTKLLLPIYKGTSDTDGKYVTLTMSDILEITNGTEIPKLYIKNVNQQYTVSTLRIKAILTSLNNKTVPYISRILIRGI